MRVLKTPPKGKWPAPGLSARTLVQAITPQGGPFALLLSAAVAQTVVFAGTGVLRAIYPFPIDGIEPGAIQEVRRVLAGQPIYVAPELGYVPFIYGPVYFYASALLAVPTGSTLLGMRLVSLLASLGSIALVALLVRRETGRLSMGLVAGGLLAACGPQVDMAMDVGRMDALSLLFLLGAICAARTAIFDPAAGWQSAAGSGALLGAGLLTKQSGIAVAAALLVLFAVTRRAQLAAFAGALAAVVCLAMVLLTLQSGPWPMFYLWDLPRRHELKRELMTRFWSDVLTRFTLPLVVGPFYLLGRALARDRKRLVFYATVTLGLLGMAWGSSSNVGGGRNVHLPAYAAFAILFGLAINEALARLETVAARTGPIRAYLLCVALAQFAVLIYNPRLVVPYSSDRWDGERLTATLAALPGPIFAGSYQGFTSDANTVSPDLGAVIELEGAFGGTGTQEGSTWEGLFAGAVAERRLSFVIVDPDKSGFIVPQLAIAYGYKDAGPLFPEGDVYWAWRTGWSPKAELYMPPPTLH